MDRKKKIAGGFLIFLLVMLGGYLVSRGIYANNLTRVDVAGQEVMSLSHSVNAAGTVAYGQQEAVFVQENLPVSRVQVRAGDQVEEGSVLLICDLDRLSELAEKKETEVAALKLQLDTLSKNEQLQKETKERQKSRALEDYQDALDAAESEVRRAGEDAEWASEQLNRHEQEKVSGTPEEEKDRQQDAYQSYLKKVQEAQLAVENTAGKAEACREQIQQKEEEITALKQAIEDGESGKQGVQNEQNEEAVPMGSEAAPASTLEEEKAKLAEAEAALLLLQEELKQTEALEAQAKQTLLAITENPITAPDFSVEENAQKQWEDTRTNLEKGVQTANRGLEDANTAKDQALQSASRVVEDADTALPADCTYETLSMELEAKEEELEEYRLLLENEGKVCAKQAGLILDVQIEAGSWTSSQAAFLLADTKGGFFFEAHLSREQKQYVSRNMQASVSLSGSQSLKGNVDYLTESPLGDGSFDARVRLEEGMGNPGESGFLKTTLQTEPYGCCVPLEALHQDFNQRDYVFVLVETEGILGTELSVRKQYVEVLDKNETYAALNPEFLGSEEKVITYATEELQEGEIVRMRN